MMIVMTLLLQVLFILGSLWLLTAWVPTKIKEQNVFKNAFLGLLTFAILLGIAYFGIKTQSPDILERLTSGPAFRFIMKNFTILIPQWNTKLIPWTAGIFAADVLYVIFRRKIYPYFQEWRYRKRKRILDRNDQSKIGKVQSVQTYLKPGYYFFGLSGMDPSMLSLLGKIIKIRNDDTFVYLSEKDLVLHLQIVGPSGTGKTYSILFPLAMQAIANGVPMIFVDGKGDLHLVESFTSAQKDIKIFNPLYPEQSHTYNPMLCSTDSSELTNLLAVGLNLNAPGEAKVYTDIQKKYLGTLLGLFLSTGQRFNFIDILEFTNYAVCKDMVYSLRPSKFYVLEMQNFLERLSKNEKELIGLTVQIDGLFTSDETISPLVNSYNPDIVFKDIFEHGGSLIASFSTGKKAQTNEALAKMMLTDIANAVAERQAKKQNRFCLLILDEFGQYAPEQFDKFISTCRSANVGVVLSHQTNAQLHSKDGSDRLAKIVRENTATKIVFRQEQEASEWAESFGTRKAYAHTEQVEESMLGTQKLSKMGTVKQVDEFICHPNIMRQLERGQAIFKSGHGLPKKIHCGMWALDAQNENIHIARKQTDNHIQGLNLRAKRLGQIAV